MNHLQKATDIINRIDALLERPKPTLTLIVRPGCEPVVVTEYIFRSWTGRRFIDGVEHFGPVFNLGSDVPAREGAMR